MTIADGNSSVIPRIAIVLPCFNEQESIKHVFSELSEILATLTSQKLIAHDSYMYFVDDGSKDASWAEIKLLNSNSQNVKGMKLSRNYGHQAALLAGLTVVAGNCDAAISIDADLQQDPKAIREFVLAFRDGADVVLGVRKDRESDSWFKKSTAQWYYKIMKSLGVNIIPNHADYRLLSKKALQALARFGEPNIFLRATCLQLGFTLRTVVFEVRERVFGKTKYSLRKMLRLALHGITSFSIVPLRIVAVLGFFVFVASLIMAGYVAWRALFVGDTVPGWASTILPIYFIGGVQLLCLGIVGEYIGQIYTTVKNRPRWISEDELG